MKLRGLGIKRPAVPARVAARWSQCSVRERRMLLAMGLLLALVGFVRGVWLPLDAAIRRNRPQVEQLSADAQLMSRMLDEARRLATMPTLTPWAAETLESRLRDTAHTQHFSLDGWTVVSEGGALRMTGTADFDRWLLLAGELERRDQLRLLQLQVSLAGSSGEVRIQALLGRGKVSE